MASQNIAMFVVARFVVGLGNGATYVCAPIYLAEMLPLKWRAIGLGMFMDCYYVGKKFCLCHLSSLAENISGGLLSAGVTYGTAQITGSWAWRLPSAIQGLFSIISVLVLPFVPETPRWLVYHGRHAEAIASIAVTHSNGNCEDPVVLVT